MFSLKKLKKRSSIKSDLAFLLTQDAYDELCIPGYTSLDKNPEVVAGCRKIADLVSSMTIHLMCNTEKGDVRITNELSRLVDINPLSTMTRKHWMDFIVMNLLLYGKGNSVVVPHTYKGYIQSLEPIPAGSIGFIPDGGYRYKIMVRGTARSPDDLLHFVHNPDKDNPYKGTGITIALRDVVEILNQAKYTEKKFMESKWKPSLIVSVDAMTEDFEKPEGKKKILNSYVRSSEAGEPWLLPADQFKVEQVKPLSLQDLAINDTVQLDKRTVAALLGMPAFVLGVGEYNKDAWNNFIANTIKPICREIEQELTRKILLNPEWYFRFNILSLYDYDLKTIAEVYGTLSDRGFVTGNEVRDRIGMSPKEGLDELRILENYIPYNMSAFQKKLVQGKEEKDG